MARRLSELQQANARLTAASCPYRIRERGGSPYLYLRATAGPDRLKERVARRWLAEREGDPIALADEVLAVAARIRPQGPLTLEHLAPILSGDPGSAAGTGAATWGDVAAMVDADTAPGGRLAKQAGGFASLRSGGLFHSTRGPDAPVRTPDLEAFALYTAESLAAYLRDPSAPLEARPPSSRSFALRLQLIRYLRAHNVPAATDALIARLAQMRRDAGGAARPRDRFMPTTAEVEAWLDALAVADPLRGWAFAVLSTYGLRPHELWHVSAWPGEIPEDATVLQVGDFASDADSKQTKTGSRFALACPVEWVARYRLNDPAHCRANHAELLRCYPIACHETPDGRIVYHRNEALGEVVCKWLYNTKRPQSEVPAKLTGSTQPRRVPGQPTPKARRGRVLAYSLRHAWAIRARELTPWPASVKAAAMGHSEAMHSRRYLVEESARSRLAALLAQKERAEALPGEPPPPPQAAPAAEAIPEALLELARKLQAAGLG
jgi:integrase